MINSRKQTLSLLAGSLLLSSIAPGALAQGEPSPLTEIERPISTRTLKTRADGQDVTMKEVRPEQVKQLLRYAEVPQTVENEGRVKKLDQQAEQLFRSGKYNDALLRWQEAYGLAIEMKYSQGQGRALTGMCKVYLTQGKWVKARHLGENAVEVLAGINDQINLGRARIALAQAYFGLDNPVWAVKQLELAIKHLVDQPKTDPEEAANLMRLSGGMLLQFGKVIEAVRFFQEAARYLEEAKDYPNALITRSKLASLMAEAGFYVAAKEEADKALILAKRSGSDRAMISALAILGNTQYTLGDFSDAIQTYSEAYTIAGKLDEKLLSKDAKANLVMGYSFSLIATGDSDKARKLLEGIIPYFETNGKYYQLTECVNAIGILTANDDEPFKALPYFQRALDSQTMIKPAQPKLQYMIYQNLASAEFAGGKYADSCTHLRTVLSILNQDKTRPMPLVKARTLVSLAEVSLKMSEPANAREYVNQAIDIAKPLSDDSLLWRAYTVQAQLELAQRDADKAKASLENALSHFRSPQAGYFPTVETLPFVTSRRAMAQQLVALVASQGMTEKALIAAEQIKEEQFISSWVRRGVPVRSEDKDVYKDLMSQRAHLHAAEAISTPEKLTREWGTWLDRFSELARKNKTLARLVAPYPTTVEDIINGVRAKKVTVVEYLVGERSSVAFTIDPIGRISATVIPVGEDKLNQQIASIVGNGSQNEETERAVLQTLYRELLPPSVVNFLPTTAEKPIVIIPDSTLYNLPFAALVDAEGKYLVEGHLLSMVPSMGVILDGTDAAADARLSVLVALNGSPDEQTESSQILNAVDPAPVATVSAQSTDLQELQRVSQDKAVLHLSGAIPLNDENPAKVKLPFAKGETTDSTAGGLFQINMPSGLVFLSGTSVKVGDPLGDQSGKAVQVVSRGLGYAGARNVMMTLWNEPSDARTTEIANFYKNKKRGLNDAQSLRQAQLLALTADRNPKAWAAFQLYGVGM